MLGLHWQEKRRIIRGFWKLNLMPSARPRGSGVAPDGGWKMTCYDRICSTVVILLVLLLTLVTAQVGATTYYVDGSHGSDANSCSNAQSPTTARATIGAGIACLSGGDELVVEDGEYSNVSNFINYRNHPIPDGLSTYQFTTIRARNRFGVTLKNSGALGYWDSPVAISGRYTHVSGFILMINDIVYPSNIVSVDGSYNKISHCIARRTGAADDYGAWFQVLGSNNLIEDCAGTGHMRYGFIAGGPDAITSKNVFRRCIGRGDYSDSNQPMAVFSFYGNNSGTGATDMAFQNCIAIDSNMSNNITRNPYAYNWGGFYFPKNAANAIIQGSIVLNCDVEYGGFTPKENLGVNLAMENCLSWGNRNSKSGVAAALNLRGTGSGVTIRNCTFGGSGEALQNRSGGGGQVFVNNTVYGNSAAGVVGTWESASNNAFFPATHSFGAQSITSNVKMTYPVVIDADSAQATGGTDGSPVGAVILKRYGGTGTFWGDPGWNHVSEEDLWPWENEKTIREIFSLSNPPNAGSNPTSNDTIRGFCANGQTLTRYIWSFLGNSAPFPGQPKNPRLLQ